MSVKNLVRSSSWLSAANIILGSVLIVVSITLIALVTSGGHSPSLTPSTVLKDDGYTQNVTDTHSQLPASLQPYATSAVGGTDGTNAEIVVVMNSSGKALASQVITQMESQDPGLNGHMVGNYLVMSAPLSDFSG